MSDVKKFTTDIVLAASMYLVFYQVQHCEHESGG